jgi:proteasome lid subunit RPN8/RPN11
MSPYEQDVLGLVDVFCTQHAYLRCCEHAESDLEHEVGGVLVGQVCRGENGGLYVVVQDIIEARHTQYGPTHLTFTQDSLVQLNSELEDCFPGRQIVGWYHTHPRMDVFLSSYDTWLHASFFVEPWQVALVIEPYAERGGFFCWQPERRFDPRCYVGFYELADTSGESVVRWRNLFREEP